MRRRILKVASAVAAFLALCLCLAVVTVPVTVPSFDQVRRAYQKSEALLLDRHHEIIHELRMDQRGRRLDWVSLSDVSPALPAAVIHAEDRRFYLHGGVDWRALLGAAAGTLSSARTRGASTISMQLASKLMEDLQPRSSRRSLWQKVKQARVARAMEKQWSKSEILEAYLNLVTFRGELQGLAAASKALFKKKPHGLNQCESLILSALLRSPNAPVDQVSGRARALSSTINSSIACANLSALTEQVLSGPHFIQPQANLAPHVAAILLEPYRKEGTPAQIVCTLDGRLQRFAIDILRHHLSSVRSQNVHDGAVLVVENKTGEVLAYVGNLGDRSSARYVDGIRAPRQAGSTLKPFLYALTLDERLATPASLLDDSPIEIPVEGGLYRPKNYDHQFHGLVTVRTALASSLNVPAVRMLNLVGVESFVRRLRDFGFKNLRPAEFYGPSLALGSADVTLLDLVNAYRMLANGGVWSEVRLTFDAKNSPVQQRVLSSEAAFIVSDILSDRESRSRTFNLESPLSTRFWSAVKTGTSKDMRDNWCVGYSNDFTVGVWAGNFSGEPMWNVSGIAGAAPVWVEVLNWLHHNRRSQSLPAPAGVIAREIELPAFNQRRREWFLRGTETSAVQETPLETNFKIVYPASGTVIALDPDIPEERQKVFFESRPRNAQLRWVLDGNEIGSAARNALWSPVPGRHRLDLVDVEDRVVDSISFEVRGRF